MPSILDAIRNKMMLDQKAQQQSQKASTLPLAENRLSTSVMSPTIKKSGIDESYTPTMKPYTPMPFSNPAADALKAQMFQNQRQQAAQNIRAQGQATQNALNRRFAAIGGLGSGASIKQQQILGEKQQQALQGAQKDINQQEQLARLTTLENQQEAERGRQFAALQAENDMAFRQNVFSFEKDSKLKQIDLAERQFQEDKAINEFNKRMAELQLQQSQGGIVESLPESIFGKGRGQYGSTVGAIGGGILGAPLGPWGIAGGAYLGGQIGRVLPF